MTRRTPAMKPDGFLSAVVTDSRAAISAGPRRTRATILPDDAPLEVEIMAVPEHAPLRHAGRAATNASLESGARLQGDRTVRRRSAAPRSALPDSGTHPAPADGHAKIDAIAAYDPAMLPRHRDPAPSAPLVGDRADKDDVRQRTRADEPLRNAANAPKTDVHTGFHEPTTSTGHRSRPADGATFVEASAAEASRDASADLEIRFAGATPAGAVPGDRTVEREAPRQSDLPPSDAVSNLALKTAESREAAGDDEQDAPDLPRARLAPGPEAADVAPPPRRREQQRAASNVSSQGASPSVHIGSVEVRIEAPAQRPPPPPREPVSFRGSSAASRLYLRRL